MSTVKYLALVDGLLALTALANVLLGNNVACAVTTSAWHLDLLHHPRHELPVLDPHAAALQLVDTVRHGNQDGNGRQLSSCHPKGKYACVLIR